MWIKPSKILPIILSIVLVGCQTTVESAKVSVSTAALAKEQLPIEVKPNVQPNVDIEQEIVYITFPTACMKIQAFQEILTKQYNEKPKVFWVHVNAQSKMSNPAILYHNAEKDTVTVVLFLEIQNATTSKITQRACLVSAGGGLQIKADMTDTKGIRIKFIK